MLFRSLGAGGYGRILIRGTLWQVHRMVYELFVGPVPPGCVLHHTCCNKCCCNPAHLEPVSHTENVLRGLPHSTVLKNRTQCAKGHALDGVRKRWNGRPYRYCLTCQRNRNYIARGKNGYGSDGTNRQAV